MNYPVTTESMLFFLARRAGLDPLVNLSPDQAMEFLTALDDRLREGWEFYDFLEITLTEERAFRADYDPQLCYAHGDYVWDSCSRSYYQALGTGVGGPLSNSAIWQPFLTVAPAYILWFQLNKTPIGSCFKAYTLNPFEDLNAVEVPFVLSTRGLEFIANQVPATVWIQFRIPYPGLGLFQWDPTITYNSGEPVIYGSDTYHSLADGNLGNVPSTSSGQWRLFRIPYVLSRFTQMAAYADSLVTNGQNEKATAEEGKAYSYLNQEYDKQTLQQGQQQRFGVYTS